MADPKPRRRKRRRQNGFIEIANALLGIIVIGLLAVGGVLFYGAQQFHAAGPTTEPTTFLVEQGNGLSTVINRLAEQGLIRDPMIFRGGAYVTDRNLTIIPGEYEVAAGASMRDIFNTLKAGDPIEYFINVPPGETSWQVAQRLNDPALKLTGEPVAVPAEGSVLPVRHDFFPGDTRASVLERMQAGMTDAVDKAWNICDADVCGAGNPIPDKAALVIMASIVEKETGLASERPQVAGLFINRLRAGMRLQTDPTIIYGITLGERTLEGGITASQKAGETAYNTYVIDGLPPGPIANPGIEALMAVANPADTSSLYMMAVTPNRPSDGHYFADTLAEHQANEARYRALEREQAAARAAAPPAEAPAAEEAPERPFPPPS